MKTNKLRGHALNWAVARCEGGVGKNQQLGAWYSPSTDWSQGGPIIEREKIGVVTSPDDANVWVGSMLEPDWKFNCAGTTPLIAAMRCYVASKLGDEVEIPAELK